MKETLFPYREGNVEKGVPFLFGFIRLDGSVAIKPEYEGVSFFGLWEGEHHLPTFPDVWKTLIMVQRKGKVGFVNPKGEILVPIQFASAGYFIEEAASVCKRHGGKWGFIDYQGEFFIAPKFDGPSHFENGLACVQVKRKYGVINRTGKWVINPDFDELGEFHDGLATAKKGSKYGFIDITGKIAIPLQYESAGEFSEGHAVVKANGQYGYIDRQGAFKIRPQFGIADRFSNGLAAVYDDNSQAYGFIDQSGQYRITARYDSAGTFFNGLVRVRDAKNRLYTMINTNGVNVLKKEFTWLDPYFHEGFVFGVLRREGQRSYGYFNTSGKLEIEVKEGEPRPFYHGLAAIELDEGIGYINKQGRYVFRPKSE